jgi:hypothetical protein
MTRPWVLATLAAAGIVAGGAGCQKSPPPIVEVTGVVTLRGKPLPKAEIRFMPALSGFGGEFMAIGHTDDSGRYRLQCCTGALGACAVENTVTVTEAPVPEELRADGRQREAAEYRKSLKNRPIPPRYANLVQTPLLIAVTADSSEYDIALEP